jgi:hypothetical protein
MQEHGTSFDMPEEPRSKPRTLVRAFNQARDVGEHEFLCDREPHHTQLRVQRGERVVRDLRPRRRHRGKERGFAGIRQPYQPRIGDQLQPQPDRALLAGPAFVGAPRRPVGRGLVVGIAEPAVAAAQQDDAPARHIQIRQ